MKYFADRLQTVNNSSERIAYLDVIRAFSMVLVVYCHYVLLDNGSIAGNVIMTCAWIGVPCFMIVSGALMHRQDAFSWKKHLFKILSTYLALCAWRIIYLLVYVGLGTAVPGVSQLISYVFFLKGMDGVNTGVMWYMEAYLVILILYPVTQYLFRKAGKPGKILTLFIMAVSGVSGIGLYSLGWVLRALGKITGQTMPDVSALSAIFPFTNYANLIFYFLAGAFLFEYRGWIADRKKRFLIISAVGFVFGIMGLLCVKYVDSSVWTWSGIFIEDGYRHLLTAVASISFYMFVSLFRCGGALSFFGRTVGKRTLGIYYLHYILLAVCSRTFFNRLPAYFFGMNMLKALAMVIICTVIVFLLEKIPVIKKLVK